MAISELVRDCESKVAGPGKYEGEARYVPYFDGHVEPEVAHDDDMENVTRFRVQPEDIELFPELAGVDEIVLCETDDGFVVDVSVCH